MRAWWALATLFTAIFAVACGGQAQRPSPSPTVTHTVALTGPASFQATGQPGSAAGPFAARTGVDLRLRPSGSWPAPISPVVGSAVSIAYGPALSDAILVLGDEGWRLAAQNVRTSDPISHWVELRSSRGVAATLTLAAVAPTLALDVQAPACTAAQAPSMSAAEAWLKQSRVGGLLPDPKPVPNPARVVGHSVPPCARVLGWETGWVSPLNPEGWWYAEVVPAPDGIDASGGLAIGGGRLQAPGWVTPHGWAPVPSSRVDRVLHGLNPARGSTASARRAIVLQPVFLGGNGLVNYVPAWAWVALRHPMQADQSMSVLATPAFRGAKSIEQQPYT